MSGKTASTKFFIISTLLVLFVVLGLYVGFNLYGKNSINNLSTISNENKSIAGIGNSIGPGLPIRLTIPSINVDAQVINVGLAKDGSVGVPEGPYQVAWFKLGPRPGEKGSAIITGHFGPWKSGAHSVFDNLHELKPGDKIYIKEDSGASLTFMVKESRVYNPNESLPEVFNKNDGTYLNLITCNGDWVATQKTYTKRLVIFTQMVT